MLDLSLRSMSRAFLVQFVVALEPENSVFFKVAGSVGISFLGSVPGFFVSTCCLCCFVFVGRVLGGVALDVVA
jgi:hypothetical protein